MQTLLPDKVDPERHEERPKGVEPEPVVHVDQDGHQDHDEKEDDPVDQSGDDHSIGGDWAKRFS